MAIFRYLQSVASSPLSLQMEKKCQILWASCMFNDCDSAHVDVEDFDFLSQGLTGVVKKQALSELVTTGGAASSPESGSAPGLADG